MSSNSLDEKVTTELVELGQDENRPVDDAEHRIKEKALVRKLDCFIAPVMMLLMLISYLDRGNIGFAATQGMTTEIGLKGSQLNVRTTTCLMPHVIYHSFANVHNRRRLYLSSTYSIS